ncbi:MAG: hypothetical protein JST80_00885 [Bdellovibrionales bacterium]|nr:hypothetical protein [Bdellovibrionales bacterium]
MKLLAALFIIFAVTSQESLAQKPATSTAQTRTPKQKQKAEETYADKIRLYTKSDSVFIGSYIEYAHTSRK